MQEEREPSGLVVPFGDQAAILWIGSEAIADQICFRGHNRVRRALILGKAADKVENQPGVDWIEQVPLSAEDKVKLMNGNAKKLLKL